MSFLILIFFFVSAITGLGIYEIDQFSFPPNGVPSLYESAPNYQERASLQWINMVRMDTISYLDYIVLVAVNNESLLSTVFNSSTYNASYNPLRWNLNLNRVARMHSLDRTYNRCDATTLEHNNCNCTSIYGNASSHTCDCASACCGCWDRMDNYYTTDAPMAAMQWTWDTVLEGSKHPYLWPFFAIAGWICDGDLYGNSSIDNCAVDDVGDSDRRILLTYSGEIGCGFAINGTEYISYTCNPTKFSEVTVYDEHHIYSGAHIMIPTISTTGSGNTVFTRFRFYASFYHPTENVTSAQVVISDGEILEMTLDSGTLNRGSWASEKFTISYYSESCVHYYFKFQYADTTEYYPFDRSSFGTFGIQDCLTDHFPASCYDTMQNQDEEGIDCGGSCPLPCYRWDNSDWDDCSIDTCGEGILERTVFCINQYNATVSDINCVEKKPSINKTCTALATCEWIIEEWSNCSSCYRTRDVYCVESNLMSNVSDNFCMESFSSIPKTKEFCSNITECASTKSNSPFDTKYLIYGGIAIGGIILIVLQILCIRWYCKKRKDEHESLITSDTNEVKFVMPSEYFQTNEPQNIEMNSVASPNMPSRPPPKRV